MNEDYNDIFEEEQEDEGSELGSWIVFILAAALIMFCGSQIRETIRNY